MQLEFEIREGRRGSKVKVMSLVISAFDGGIILKKLWQKLGKIIWWTVQSGLVQSDWLSSW